MVDYKNEIVNDLLPLAKDKSPYDVFSDWVECMAISITNAAEFIQNEMVIHEKAWQEKEERFARIVTSYNDKGETFGRMMANLTKALEEPKDILGEVYMELGCGNKNTGQFFTPYDTCRLMAKLTLKGIEPNESLKLHEPSCGSGGTIIAMAAELKEHGINYQNSMCVIAQDLDWKAVYMCYVQLSLLGIKAVVVQGDTLMEPYTGNGYPKERTLYTPANIWII